MPDKIKLSEICKEAHEQKHPECAECREFLRLSYSLLVNEKLYSQIGFESDYNGE